MTSCELPEGAWIGCQECDCSFACYEGKATCIRNAPITESAEAPVADKSPKRIALDAMADALFKEWCRVEPDSEIAKYPVSYMASFVDMARVALAHPATLPAVAGVTEALRGLIDDTHATYRTIATGVLPTISIGQFGRLKEARRILEAALGARKGE